MVRRRPTDADPRGDNDGHMATAGNHPIADTPQPISPCDACRQEMIELGGPQLPVLLVNLQGLQRATTAGELLPGSFTLDPERG